MAEPYLGEIRLFPGNYAPVGWAACDGQLLNIADYGSLYAVIGTTYGGDGQTTFALPDLRGRVPIHPGTGYPLAAQGGTETVTLTANHLPSHSHVPNASGQAGNQPSPAGNVWAGVATNPFVATTTGGMAMSSQAIASAGGGQPHANMMPFGVLTFIIALQGTFPPQN